MPARSISRSCPWRLGPEAPAGPSRSGARRRAPAAATSDRRADPLGHVRPGGSTHLCRSAGDVPPPRGRTSAGGGCPHPRAGGRDDLLADLAGGRPHGSLCSHGAERLTSERATTRRVSAADRPKGAHASARARPPSLRMGRRRHHVRRDDDDDDRHLPDHRRPRRDLRRRVLRHHRELHLRPRHHRLGLDPPAARAPPGAGRLRALRGRSLGRRDRNRAGRSQRGGELLHPVLPVLVAPHHRARRLGDLGADETGRSRQGLPRGGASRADASSRDHVSPDEPRRDARASVAGVGMPCARPPRTMAPPIASSSSGRPASKSFCIEVRISPPENPRNRRSSAASSVAPAARPTATASS